MLQPSTVLEHAEGLVTVRLEEPQTAVKAGYEILVHFDHHSVFSRCPATVETVVATEPRQIVALRFAGEPVPAESRQCYRVSTVTAGLIADVDGHACPVLNVSATGFAIRTLAVFRTGQTLDVQIGHEGRVWTGQASVQMAHEMEDGAFRCGLHAVEDRRTRGDLQRGLQAISVSIQQQQLRRRAGRAGRR